MLDDFVARPWLGAHIPPMSRVVTAGESATLSRELTDFLIEFSIGLHKHAIYPPGHPLLDNTTADLSTRLARLLRNRKTLSLGVARHQLIIEGVATDEKNPVLRELANRLHKHHLGAVKFSAGVTEDELTDMLARAAVDAGRLPRPLGLEGPEVLTQWPHVRLFPLTFAQLQLIAEDPNATEAADDGLKASGSRAAALWVGLARAALVAQAEKLDTDDPAGVDPAVVAQAIEEHKRDAAYDQVVVGYLLQIAEELRHKSGREAAALQRRISQLIAQLSPATLERLVHMGGNRAQQKQFVLNAAQGMALDAVVDLVRAASESTGQNVSHSMARMLSKLASHAESGPLPTRAQADSALRDQVKTLMEGWALDDPNPAGYSEALEKMTRAEPVARAVAHRYPIEPERLLAMGLEIETLGEQVWHSADVMAQRADVTPLLNLVDNAPSLWMRDTLWRHVATPQRLRLHVALEPPRVATLERMVRRMGVSAVSPLLDAFEESTDERRQQTLMLLLECVGPAAGPEILARLPGMRWKQLRPLLALLGRHAEWACGFDVTQWKDHPDAAVRRETLRQLLRAPESRDAAIVRALADADEGNVRLGLGAAMTNCPRDAALMLRTRADEASLSADLRALGIRALSSDGATDTPTWLVGRVRRVGKLLRRETLASKSPEMLASIEGLAIHWRTHPAAAPVLALAAASGDPEIAAAAAITALSRADTLSAGTFAVPADAPEETP